MKKVRAKKHLGQHFLTLDGIAANIAGSLGYSKNVLEIGPGTGILTVELVKRNFDDFKVVEIDTESVDYLRENRILSESRIIEGDFLNLDISALFNGEPFALCGNFPYNISSQILFRIFENKNHIPEMVGMFQKEVAERAVSPEGSKVYGILSVLLQSYYNVEYLFTVEPEAFDPPPKVKSGVIRLLRNNAESLPVPDSFFKSVVKAAFNLRRKTLRNSLGGFIPEKGREEWAETLKIRPEQMSVAKFIELATWLYSSRNN